MSRQPWDPWEAWYCRDRQVASVSEWREEWGRGRKKWKQPHAACMYSVTTLGANLMVAERGHNLTEGLT